jgi:beta-D-xylosidase 4
MIMFIHTHSHTHTRTHTHTHTHRSHAEYAEWYVKGMESHPEDPSHIMASACCKHYVANSMDGTTEKDGEHHDRNHYDANITQQDLIDSYMVPFQACVEKGKVSGLMCSYNSVNGVPSCANDWLLTDTARNEWGFDGYVTSDCDADNDVVFSHHYTDDPLQGVQDVLRAGTDNDCGGFVGKYAAEALNKSYITEEDIDTRLRWVGSTLVLVLFSSTSAWRVHCVGSA